MKPASTATRAAFTAALLAISFNAAPVAAQTRQLSEAGLRDLLKGVSVQASKEKPGWLALGTMRDPDIQLKSGGFELMMHWNGIDDSDWPFARVLASVASHYCGPMQTQAADAMIERLYKTKSLVRARDLGGNAGSTMRHRLTATAGQCRIQLLAEGARWHTLSASVTVNAAGR